MFTVFSFLVNFGTIIAIGEDTVMFKIFEVDSKIVRLLEEHLHKFGFETKTVGNFETVRGQFEQFEISQDPCICN